MKDRGRKRRKRYRFSMLWGAGWGLVISLLGLAFLMTAAHYEIQKKPDKPRLSAVKREPSADDKRQKITPTLLVTGSSGNVLPLHWLLQNLLPIDHLPATEGLTLIVSTDGSDKVTATGFLSRDNAYPLILIGMTRGTIDGRVYSRALQAAVSYLTARYRVTDMNMMGYSSGATGVLYYLCDTGHDKDFPKVRKVVSLDGEFNTKNGLSRDESLSDVLSRGPSAKTDMYRYIETHATAIDPSTQIALLAGNYQPSQLTDGVIPWADSFSIYHLLSEHGNPVSNFLYPTSVSHGYDTKNLSATAYIKNFFYDSAVNRLQ